MAGKRDRAILMPRYTTLAGDGDYTSIPIDVSAYEGGELVAWRGKLVGPDAGTGSVSVTFQESSDQVTWSICAGTASGTLSENTETQFVPAFKMAWMRVKVTLTAGTGDLPIVSCYVVGYLTRRRA